MGSVAFSIPRAARGCLFVSACLGLSLRDLPPLGVELSCCAACAVRRGKRGRLAASGGGQLNPIWALAVGLPRMQDRRRGPARAWCRERKLRPASN